MSPSDVYLTVKSSEEDLKYLDRSEGYVALSDPRRRYVIRLLDDADGSLSLLDLAREIVRWERDDQERDGPEHDEPDGDGSDREDPEQDGPGHDGPNGNEPEGDEPEGDLPDEAVEQVLISLYHIHVPKLADAGFVRYNTDEQQVALSAGAPLDFLETLEE